MAVTRFCPAAAPRPLRILIAEDNEMLRYSVRELLRGFGHLVEAVANGQEAVEAGARQAYDLVFLDIQMPELCGFEAARTLRRVSPGGGQARIIGFSAERRDAETYEAAGMDDFLDKPVLLADLIRVLSHFGQHEERQE
jgi:two-component system, sensor histidine kinase